MKNYFQSQEKMATLSNWIWVIVILAAAFFIVAALIMVTWNYAVPRLAASIDSNYNRATYTKIDYYIAMAFTLLIGLIWGASAIQITRDIVNDVVYRRPVVDSFGNVE